MSQSARLPSAPRPLVPLGKDDCTAWTLAGDHVVILDLARDRYFRLPDRESADVRAAVERGEIGGWAQPSQFPRPHDWMPADQDSAPVQPAGFNLPGIAASLWLQRRLERRLEMTPFCQLLLQTRSMVEAKVRSVGGANTNGLHQILSDFEHARLIRSAANRCVPRSLAILLRCASQGIRAHAVIGVTADPFQAHCWAQHDTIVLGDTIDNVTRFTPLLVL